MIESLLQLLGGLILIVKGGDWLVGATIRTATFLRQWQKIALVVGAVASARFSGG